MQEQEQISPNPTPLIFTSLYALWFQLLRSSSEILEYFYKLSKFDRFFLRGFHMFSEFNMYGVFFYAFMSQCGNHPLSVLVDDVGLPTFDQVLSFARICPTYVLLMS